MNRKKLVLLDQARSKQQLDLMERIQKDGVCPFCRENLERYHSEPIIEETSFWVVTKNLIPYEGAKIHLLLIYKTSHATELGEIPGVAVEDLQRLVKKYCELFDIKGATLIIRFGDHDYTGGSVEHLHAHLVVGVKKSKTTKSIKTKIGFSK